jgi:hypothetical protein
LTFSNPHATIGQRRRRLALTLYSLEKEEIERVTEELTGHAYSPQALRKAIDQRKLHCHWLGKHPLVSRDDLITYLEKHGRWKPKELQKHNQERLLCTKNSH